MGAKKRYIFKPSINHHSQLGFVISSGARIEILKYIDEKAYITGPIIENYIALDKRTLNQHINVLEREGLIHGFYFGRNYFWKKKEGSERDWEKIRWAWKDA